MAAAAAAAAEHVSSVRWQVSLCTVISWRPINQAPAKGVLFIIITPDDIASVAGSGV